MATVKKYSLLRGNERTICASPRFWSACLLDDLSEFLVDVMLLFDLSVRRVYQETHGERHANHGE